MPPADRTDAARLDDALLHAPRLDAPRLDAPRLGAPRLHPHRLHDDDKPHEECGVFGVWNLPSAAAVTALGLHALQHRGQEATGIVTFDGDRFHSHRGMGLVGDNFSDARVIAGLPGSNADRPQPLRHHRRHHPAQCPAAVCRFRVRRLRGRAQRQPDQRPHPAPHAGAPRLPVPVHHRHRGVRPPDRHQPVFHCGRPADRRAEAGGRRLFAGRAVERGADGRARSARRAPADPRPGDEVGRPGAGCWRRRPARSTSSAPSSSATSSRARSS